MATQSTPDPLQAVLRQLRGTFLEELPEKFDRLEYLLLEMERNGANTESFNEAYRIVHSLKGSGGTFGLHIITTICHQMEDLLNTTEGGTKFTPRLVAFSLKYLDLLQLAAEQINAGAESFLQVEQQLADLRQQLAPKHFSVLLANNSKLETSICLQTLSNLPVHAVVINDGLEALARALSEHFDLVITANEIPRLNGIALVGALKLSESSLPHIKTILLTSNKAVIKPDACINADHIILKDGKLSQNLAEAVKSALGITP